MPPIQDPKTKRWRYRFSVRGQVYSGTAPRASNTKATATRMEKEHAERVTHGRKSIALPDFAPVYLEHQEARTKPLSYKNEKSRVKVIVATLGPVRLEAIDKAMVDDAVTKWRKAKVMPRTINLRLATLSHLLETARERKHIAGLPEIETVPVPEDTPRFLTVEEANRLLTAAWSDGGGRWYSMFIIGLDTGLRVGELRGLQWSDVDLAGRCLHVRRTHPGRKGMEPTTPKSNKHRRVPLTDRAREVLYAEREHSHHPWVFPNPRGKPWSERGCHCAILKAALDAGLRDVGWHTLRHTFASWLVMRGVPLKLVQEWLGHSSIRQTERYSHLTPAFGDEAIRVLDVKPTKMLTEET